jgi:hypothetical protein
MSLKNPLPVSAQFTDAATLGGGLVLPRLHAVTQPARVLVLFGADWDDKLLPRYERHGRYRFHRHGFDLFSFPSNARLMWFDVWRFVDRMVERYRGRIDAVFSSNEQFGALAAALIAQRLGLPGADPVALLRAQHKYEARSRLRDFAPDLCPSFDLIPYTITIEEARRLSYPLFVKPVKATFSVLARRCDSPEELIAHLRFKPWERHIIKRLIEPHNQAMSRFPQLQVDSHHLVVEAVMRGRQVNVDGYVHDGRFELLGIADEVMYPGTMAFMRFASPSSLALDSRTASPTSSSSSATTAP